jgi:hypothetical protein
MTHDIDVTGSRVVPALRRHGVVRAGIFGSTARGEAAKHVPDSVRSAYPGWIRDENAGRHEDLPEPEEIAAEITARLQEALAEMEELTALLNETNPETGNIAA